jgi:hypothetical protein
VLRERGAVSVAADAPGPDLQGVTLCERLRFRVISTQMPKLLR